MKVAFATLFVVGAALTNAIAVADPSPEARRGGKKLGFCGPPGMACARDLATCGIPGSPCARLKRSADAVADAFAAADNGKRGWCGADGQSCHKARRSILEVGEAVEEAVQGLYTREAFASAEARRGGKKLGFCGPPGMACAKKFRREADAEARRGGKKLGFCGPPGMACAKSKRDAEADAEARRGGKKLGFCGPPGMACAKSKREATADPEARRGGKKLGFCGPPGMACAKVRHDLESVSNTEDEIKVARGIDSVDPEFFKRVRDAEDGEGTALRAAHAAFLEVKRDSEEIEDEDMTAFQLLQFCDEYTCDEESVAAIISAANEDLGNLKKRDAEACNAVGGACEMAKRQLNEIEAKLEAAVKAL